MDYFGEGFLFLSIFLNLGIDLSGYIYYHNYRATESGVKI
nr:MAG TPA: SecD/SecF GG Motif [Bacteriophage sp.]